jgi:hypothetical protein
LDPQWHAITSELEGRSQKEVRGFFYPSAPQKVQRYPLTNLPRGRRKPLKINPIMHHRNGFHTVDPTNGLGDVRTHCKNTINRLSEPRQKPGPALHRIVKVMKQPSLPEASPENHRKFRVVV